MKNQKGFSTIGLIAGTVIVLSFGYLFFTVWQNGVDSGIVTIAPLHRTAKNVNTNAATNANTAIVTHLFSFTNAKVGDHVAGMTITMIGRYLENRPDVSPNQKIQLTGQATITGRITSEFSEMSGQDDVCIHDLTPSSELLIPRLDDDTNPTTFCFTNAAALANFPRGTNSVATIIIDSYVIAHYPSEVRNSAIFISRQVDITGWKTYTNTDFSFSIKHPADWKVITSKSNNATAVTLESANKGESVSFFPEGEFDFGPPSYKTTVSVTLGGKTANRVSYSANADGSSPTFCFYQYTTAPETGWVAPNNEGKNGNRIHTACTESATVKTMLSTLTFDETLGWKTYTNSTWGFSFKYPADWLVSQDALTTTVKTYTGPNDRLVLRKTGSTSLPSMILWVDVDGFGPSFPNQVWTVAKGTSGFTVTRKTTEDPSPYRDSSVYAIETREASTVTQKRFLMKFDQNSTERTSWDGTVESVLSTFTFTQ